MNNQKKTIKQAWSLHRNSKSYTGAFPEGFIKNLDKFIGIKGKKVQSNEEFAIVTINELK